MIIEFFLAAVLVADGETQVGTFDTRDACITAITKAKTLPYVQAVTDCLPAKFTIQNPKEPDAKH